MSADPALMRSCASIVAFMPGAAYLVDGCSAGGIRQAGATRSLTGGGLSLSGWQHAAHQHLVDLFRREAGAFQGRADNVRA